jgi:molecular chaperone DnaK
MTRMPAVRRLASEITNQEPCAAIDPDKVVAMGAAIQAGVLAGRVRRVTLVDVTALSLGIETQGGLFARIIERNTPIPASRNKLFTNALDNQTAMDIRVLQGEREMAEDNMTLETFELTGMTAQPRGQARAEVTFDIDASGVVQVSATDLQTEQSSQIRLLSANRPPAEVVEAALAESRRLVASDRRRREEVETAILAGNMIGVARELLTDAGELTDNAQINELADATEEATGKVQAALAAGDSALIGAAAAELEAAFKQLDSAMAAAAVYPLPLGEPDGERVSAERVGPAAATDEVMTNQFLG